MGTESQMPKFQNNGNLNLWTFSALPEQDIVLHWSTSERDCEVVEKYASCLYINISVECLEHTVTVLSDFFAWYNQYSLWITSNVHIE